MFLDEATLTPETVASAPPMDRVVFLALEALRLPRRSDVHSVDLSADINLSPSSPSPAIGRIRNLFSASPIANTYLALHFTPLHDLLAVSGDSWLFSQKLLGAESFQQRQKRLRRWSGSRHAGAAAGFAAEALLYFLDHDKHDDNDDDDYHDFPATSSAVTTVTQQTTTIAMTTTSTCTTTTKNADGDSLDRAADSKGEIEEEDDDDHHNDTYGEDGRQRERRTRQHNKQQRRKRQKPLDDISDYWSMYVCALICWALSHHAARQTAATAACGGSDSLQVPPSSPPASDGTTVNGADDGGAPTVTAGGARGNPRRRQGRRREEEEDRGALEWLRAVAARAGEPGDVLDIRGRAEAIGVVGLVGRSLEDEAAGGGRSRLLVDARGVLKKLDEGVNWRWF